MPNPIRVLTVDAAGTLIKPWPSVGAVYAKTARKYGIEINDKQVDERFYEVLGQAQKNKKITLGEEKDFWREVVTLTFKPFAKGQDIDPIFEILWDLFFDLPLPHFDLDRDSCLSSHARGSDSSQFS